MMEKYDDRPFRPSIRRFTHGIRIIANFRRSARRAAGGRSSLFRLAFGQGRSQDAQAQRKVFNHLHPESFQSAEREPLCRTSPARGSVLFGLLLVSSLLAKILLPYDVGQTDSSRAIRVRFFAFFVDAESGLYS